jgi:hypothetical protein
MRFWNNGIVETATGLVRGMRYRSEAVAPAVLVAVAAVGVYAFLSIAEEVAEGEVRAWDEALFLALRNPADTAQPFGPPWLQEAALEITALGGYAIIVLALAAVTGLLLVTAAMALRSMRCSRWVPERWSPTSSRAFMVGRAPISSTTSTWCIRRAFRAGTP